MTEPVSLNRVPSGIAGLDHILRGGFISGRPTLVVGSSGSGKTILALQCLHNQIQHDQKKCLFVTFEERPSDIIRNAKAMGWDLQQYLQDQTLHFVDASPDLTVAEQSGSFDLSGLLEQIRHIIRTQGIEFVVMDSLGALFFNYQENIVIRREIFKIIDSLRENNVTSIITAERLEEYGSISRFGVEEFVTDGVVILRYTLMEEKIRRTVQIYKLRGSDHAQGEYAFTIGNEGINLSPLPMTELTQSSSTRRVTFGDADLDAMSGGGLFNDSVLLVSGPTGAGKTLLCSIFAAGGCRADEKCLYLGFEESKLQLVRNAASWGFDFAKWEQAGLLRLECVYPEYHGLEDHLMRIRKQIDAFQPTRIVVDSVSALERVGDKRIFREFVIGLTALVKQKNICSLFTSTSPKLSGGDSITDTHISTITDAIVLLRYIEADGFLKRGLVVLKMRGSAHDKAFREYSIDSNGIQIGNTIRGELGLSPQRQTQEKPPSAQ